MIIQALYSSLKLLGKFSEQDIAEFIGWLSVKQSVRPHYAKLTRMEVCQMIADLDQDSLPWDMATVADPPRTPYILEQTAGDA
jgi:hypothetical protein